MASASKIAGTTASLDELRDLMGEDGLRELIDVFIADSGVHLDVMGSALVWHNAKLLAEEAHALKGSSATVGATQMAKLCDLLEHRGRAGTVLGADRLLESLVDELERVTGFLAESRHN
jgi:HPt (histidine-containing phosphotransfer) domain-containing protein